MSAEAAEGVPLTHGEPSDEDEDDNGRSFEAFERQYAADHSWESLQEDEQGFLRPLDATKEMRERRARALSSASSGRLRKGMLRHLLLVLDMSAAAAATDMRPSRLRVMLGAARALVRRFFELNPLGQLGVGVLRDGVALKLTDLSGSPEAQVARIQALQSATGGAASLQNCLELGLELLGGVPPYGSRELLLLSASLSSVDPGRVEDSIAAVKEARIRVSVVGVAAEVHVLRRAADSTGGTYCVATSESHLSELLLMHAAPPPAPAGQLSAELVRMGFPQRAPSEPAAAVYVGELPALVAGGYTCPRCRARTRELPCKCHVCGLPLVSSPHLAASYHHLFPVPAFSEVEPQQLDRLQADSNNTNCSSSSTPWHEPGGAGGWRPLHCYACLRPLVWSGSNSGCGAAAAAAAGVAAGIVLRCDRCLQLFCFDCDVFVHDVLHNCPGCECTAGAATVPTTAAVTTNGRT